MTKITEHFYWSEAACKDGTEVPSEYRENVEDVSNDMEIVRKVLGNYPIEPNSWYRTVSYNKKIGGAPASQHLEGKAIDFGLRQYDPIELFSVLNTLMDYGIISQGGLFLYDWGVHYDIRVNRVRGNYSTNFNFKRERL